MSSSTPVALPISPAIWLTRSSRARGAEHVRAGLAEAAGDRFADAAGGAGDECGLAGEVDLHAFLLQKCLERRNVGDVDQLDGRSRCA